jgi:hypothetical protein
MGYSKPINSWSIGFQTISPDITISGGGEGDIVYSIDSSDWITRKTIAASEGWTAGDYVNVTDTSAVYRWTGSDLVRPEVYEYTLTQLGRVPYTVSGSGDLVGFAASESNGGAVTYASGYVDMESSGANNQTALLTVAHSATSANGVYVAGYFYALSISGQNATGTNSIQWHDGSEGTVLLLRPSTDEEIRFTGPGGTTQEDFGYSGNVNSDFGWVEMLRLPDGRWRHWLDHDVTPGLIAIDSGNPSAIQDLFIGDTTGLSAGHLRCRDVTAWVLS